MRDHEPASDHMISRARQLRQDAVKAERLLWSSLRGRRCGGLKFRRQQPIGPYVADFFCAAARLVVELDGETHVGREISDRQRQDYIERQGIKVIRFPNDQFLAAPEEVLAAILAVTSPLVRFTSPSRGRSARRAG